MKQKRSWIVTLWCGLLGCLAFSSCGTDPFPQAVVDSRVFSLQREQLEPWSAVGTVNFGTLGPCLLLGRDSGSGQLVTFRLFSIPSQRWVQGSFAVSAPKFPSDSAKTLYLTRDNSFVLQPSIVVPPDGKKLIFYWSADASKGRLARYFSILDLSTVKLAEGNPTPVLLPPTQELVAGGTQDVSFLPVFGTSLVFLLKSEADNRITITVRDLLSKQDPVPVMGLGDRAGTYDFARSRFFASADGLGSFTQGFVNGGGEDNLVRFDVTCVNKKGDTCSPIDTVDTVEIKLPAQPNPPFFSGWIRHASVVGEDWVDVLTLGGEYPYSTYRYTRLDQKTGKVITAQDFGPYSRYRDDWFRSRNSCWYDIRFRYDPAFTDGCSRQSMIFSQLGSSERVDMLVADRLHSWTKEGWKEGLLGPWSLNAASGAVWDSKEGLLSYEKANTTGSAGSGLKWSWHGGTNGFPYLMGPVGFEKEGYLSVTKDLRLLEEKSLLLPGKEWATGYAPSGGYKSVDGTLSSPDGVVLGTKSFVWGDKLRGQFTQLRWSPGGGYLFGATRNEDGTGDAAVKDVFGSSQLSFVLRAAPLVAGSMWLSEGTLATVQADGMLRVWDMGLRGAVLRQEQDLGFRCKVASFRRMDKGVEILLLNENGTDVRRAVFGG